MIGYYYLYFYGCHVSINNNFNNIFLHIMLRRVFTEYINCFRYVFVFFPYLAIDSFNTLIFLKYSVDEYYFLRWFTFLQLIPVWF